MYLSTTLYVIHIYESSFCAVCLTPSMRRERVESRNGSGVSDYVEEEREREAKKKRKNGR